MHHRIDDVLAGVNQQLFDFFGDIVRIFQGHLVIDDDVDIHMQVAPDIARAEPMQANHLGVRKRLPSQFSENIGIGPIIHQLAKPRPGDFDCGMQNEKRDDQRTDGVREPQFREENGKNDSHKHRNRAKRIAPVVPSIRLQRLAADFFPALRV